MTQIGAQYEAVPDLPGNISSTSNNLTPNLSIYTDNLYNANTGTGAGHIAFDANLQAQLDTVASKRAEIIDYIRLRLGDQIVDVEADKEHYEMGINQALIRYRQRSSNSVEESYAFLNLAPETQEYILPNSIMNVRQIFRRGIGSVSGTTASQFEPFSSGYLNTYMLVAGRVGGLTNYELFVDYQKLAMTMFGGYMNFTWNKVTKKLTIVRKMPFGYAGYTGKNEDGNGQYESILLWIDNYKPDIMLLNDNMTFPWIQDYALALVSMSIGQAREKFNSIAGPQGGTALNGTALKQEGKELLERLDDEIKRYVDGAMPLTWVTG
jgi:hypothetical protein